MGVGATLEKPLIKRRFWKMARVIVLLVRKCMVKRRYLHEEFTKMGKLLANNWRSMILESGSRGQFGIREYEFSCSNSPAFTNKLTRSRHRSCFSYPRSTSLEDEEVHINMRDQDVLQHCNFPAVEDGATQTYDLGDGEELGTPVSRSVDVRVDREVEDFIARFHRQIKFERQISLLEYEEMLARGA